MSPVGEGAELLFSKIGVESVDRKPPLFLGSVCKLRKQENGSESNHGSKVLGAFFIASGNPAKLLDAVDETFNNIASAILLFVKATTMLLVLPSRNGVANASSA